MKRTKTTKLSRVDYILTGDWHLREDTPVCRTDHFQTSQWNKVFIIKTLQSKYNCPVIHSGDLFNHWKPSPWLLSKAMEHIPDQFYTVYGNHDLPQHSIQLEDKSGIFAMSMAGKLTILPGTHWGEAPGSPSYGKILVWHTMTYQGKIPWPGCTDPTGTRLLKKYPEYDLILTGHNHKAFVAEWEGRLLVNPGSLMRQDADQIDHRPRVYLYDAEENGVEPYYLPIEREDVSRTHIERDEARSNRISAFVERLNTGEIKGANFEENLDEFFHNNKIRESVKNITYKAIES